MSNVPVILSVTLPYKTRTSNAHITAWRYLSWRYFLGKTLSQVALQLRMRVPAVLKQIRF